MQWQPGKAGWKSRWQIPCCRCRRYSQKRRSAAETIGFWDETWVFNPSLGVSLLQDLAQITSPLCFTPRFFTCEMGKKAAS